MYIWKNKKRLIRDAGWYSDIGIALIIFVVICGIFMARHPNSSIFDFFDLLQTTQESVLVSTAF